MKVSKNYIDFIYGFSKKESPKEFKLYLAKGFDIYNTCPIVFYRNFITKHRIFDIFLKKLLDNYK